LHRERRRQPAVKEALREALREVLRWRSGRYSADPADRRVEGVERGVLGQQRGVGLVQLAP